LRGARLVTAIETEASARLAGPLVKALTGRDRIVTRALYRDAEEFTPTFTIFLAANEPPRVRDDDPAIWRRLVRLPFLASIPADERDPAVKTELLEDPTARAAVLAWAVEGAKRYAAEGLHEPTPIRQATDAWRRELNPVAEFALECLEDSLTDRLRPQELREAYERWCQRAGERPLGRKRFNAHLEACGGQRDGNKQYWLNVSLRPEARS
jgi:putative DNA primase/helicase